ncbi:MAG: hypothetical protein IKP00_10950 [Victivallales bacterium]|nr:hypothetical protein [Victivallales bacterium]
MKQFILALALSFTSAFAAEYLKNGDFEGETTAPWRLKESKATISLTSDNVPAGGGRNVLAVHLPDGENKVALHQKVKLEPGTYTFSGYVDTTGVTVPRGFVQFYVSGTLDGKWKNYGSFHIGGTLPKLGWRKHPWTKLETTITIPENGVGASVWCEFINTTGTVLMDNFSISDDKPQPAPKPVEKPQKPFVVTLHPGGYKALYTLEQPLDVTLQVENAPASLPLEVTYTTTDYFGKLVGTTKATYQLKADEPLAVQAPCPDSKQPGFFCTTAFWKAGTHSGETQVSFVKVAQLPSKPDPLFGISVFAGEDAARYKLMGVGTKGVYFQWRYLEDENGNLQLDDIRAKIKDLRAAGIKIIGHFGTVETGRLPRRYLKKQVPPKQDPIENPELFYKDKEEFVYRIVSAFKDDIHEWAASGEINLLAYQADYIRQRYIDEVKVISRAIRRADPTASYVAIGCSGADGRANPRYPFLRGILPAIVDDIDGFGIDQYTAGQTYGKGYVNKNTEEGQIREMMLAALQIARENGKHALSIEEKGPSIIRKTPLDSPLGITMANMVARDYIILKTVPEVRHWLYFRPDNWSKTSIVDWGMWEMENPRQVVSAYSATARTMAHATFIKFKSLCEDIPCWIFQKDGKFFATLWYNGAEPLDFRLPASQKASVLDVQGNPVVLKDNSMVLADAPQYLLADSLDALEALLDGAQYTVPELGATMEVVALNKTQLVLRNLSGKPFTATVSKFTSEPSQVLPASLSEAIPLAPNETRSLDLPFAAKECTIALTTSNGQIFTINRSFNPYRLVKISGWDEISKAQPVVVNDPSRQMPGYDDLKANKVYDGPNDLSLVGRFAYDDTFFYMEYVVKDDLHYNEQTPARCFNGDCIQYGFDTRKDARIKWLKGIQGFSDDDYNFVSALASGQPVTHCYMAATENNERLRGKELAPPTIIRDEATKTTTYRVAIPFADLTPLRPIPGRTFGFSFLAFDSDGKDTKLIHIEATPGITNPTNPAEFIEFAF